MFPEGHLFQARFRGRFWRAGGFFSRLSLSVAAFDAWISFNRDGGGGAIASRSPHAAICAMSAWGSHILAFADKRYFGYPKPSEKTFCLSQEQRAGGFPGVFKDA